MLNKKNRIGNHDVIDRLFRKGTLFKNHFFIFKYERVSGVPSQFAVTVSKKIHKKAVKRNRLRRQVQEALRLSLPLLNIPVKALIIARPDSEKISYEDIIHSIATFFNFLASNAK
ncbi:ribonuclease P protein component [Candidatus Peregrinibacteria bacterium]|nr:ribonuclease P protein component [Candidatus Peregrinibacteria bacterium]